MEREHPNRVRGISTAVGVALLIAITMLLAATAAAYVVGFGPSNQSADAPMAAFNFDYSKNDHGEELDISHRTGDDIAADNLIVVIDGANCVDPDSNIGNSGSGTPDGRYTAGDLSAPTTVSAGVELFVTYNNVCEVDDKLILESATVEVIWRNNGESRQYGTWRGPAV